MRILVTGGAGFIGSHLCRALLERGQEVVCLDNLFTGSKRNIRDLFDYADFEFVRHDIIEPMLIEVDRVYHLACPASPVHYQYNPIKTVKTNVIGTINTLGIAKRVKARYLIASTSEVYGNPLQHPQTEEYWGNVNPIGIRSCYDEGKRMAETLTMDYHRSNKVDTRIVRIFNTYGPNMHPNDGRVVSNFIVQALKGEPITIYGDGQQTRSFCYVSDLVRGLMSMMEQEETIGPVNLGNPDERTILDLANKIIEKVGKGELSRKPLPKDDPTQRKPDITKAKQYLNWTPEVDIDCGLEATIQYFQQRLEEDGNHGSL